MNSNPPSVSILLSTFQGEKYINVCMESVLNQSQPDFELLIIDDASTDHTVNLIKNYRDPRILFTRNVSRQGLYSNLNRLIKQANAPLLKFLGQDDILFQNCLETGSRFFQAHPSLGYFYCSNDTINSRGIVVRPPAPDENTPTILDPPTADKYSLLYGCLSANISNLFIPRHIVKEFQGFDATTISADFDLLVRIQASHAVGFMQDALLHVRDHNAQWSRNLDGVSDYIIRGIDLHLQLKDRVVYKHLLMDENEARRILIQKAAVSYFDNAMMLFYKGKFIEARKALRALEKVTTITNLGRLWLRIKAHRLLLKAGIPGIG